jgi:two-component system phosphate regulon sensor histidine kinase PhoR
MVCQASRMRSIVEDLLTLSRLEMDDRTEQIGPVDIPAEIRTITHEAEALSEGRHKISLDVDQNLLVQGNLVELRSALSNLIYNAIKHTPAGSHVRIAWHREEAQPVFTVTDDGEGIAAEHIPRLTERFYRIDKGRSRASGGTGLGLAIVNHVLNRHEARLIIASEPGKGSTFTCRFPAASGLTRLENQKIDAGL